jgi:hypothetical protein
LTHGGGEERIRTPPPTGGRSFVATKRFSWQENAADEIRGCNPVAATRCAEPAATPY